MSTSLESIAKAAGVAVSTVSRALAGKTGVSEHKRLEIIALAKSLGFTPDPVAASLRTGGRSGLAVITAPRPTRIASLRNYALFARGREAFGHVRVLVAGEDVCVDEAVSQALSQKAAAVVITGVNGELSPGTVERLKSVRVALVTVDCDCNAGDSLLIDRAVGTRQCARLLLLNGCRTIVVLSNTPLGNPDPRLRGIAEGFASLGATLDASQVIVMEQAGFEGGYRSMERLLGQRSFDGAFCYSDDCALGALRSLAEHHLRVPEDAQIIGFDNVEYAGYGPKPLTTIAQPVDEIAQAAIERCQARLARYDDDAVALCFPTSLVVRASAPILKSEIRAQVFEKG